ncbi:MAG: acyl-CoA dehydrogenase family protein [Candidatus Competibacteraceae bacterium]|jgi:alkylation response protein AidB-like acyl-CoA dehydrogenase|nr:acyl-CoA dehydrogenase family protein [Candidatus Competibacteraceae bacterium]
MSSDNKNEVYEEFRDVVRRFAEEKVKPFAAIIDHENRAPEEAFEAARELGLQGVPFPEEFGGSDGDLMLQVITAEELARVCASSSLTISSSWLFSVIVENGSDELKALVHDVASGEKKAAWCLTEPQAGSDLMAIKGNAKKVDGGWVINGNKRFITNGGWADWYLVLVRTGSNDDRSFGVFVVSKDDEGISFGAKEDKMGQRGSPTSDVILDDCFVPDFRCVGDPQKGLLYFKNYLKTSRLTISGLALGIAQGALDEAVRYTNERVQMGQAIAQFQMVKGMIADMAVKVESSRALLYKAVNMSINNEPGVESFSSMAKIACCDAAMAVATDAVQLHGGYGYLKEYPIERMFRDAKITQIYDGSNQVMRQIVADQLNKAQKG